MTNVAGDVTQSRFDCDGGFGGVGFVLELDKADDCFGLLATAEARAGEESTVRGTQVFIGVLMPIMT